MSPGLAPARVTAHPRSTSPMTVILIEDCWIPGYVPSDKPHAEIPGGACHTAQEFVEPHTRARSGQGECQQEEPRAATHGREVTASPHKGFEADGIRWVAIGQQMNIFQKRIAA